MNAIAKVRELSARKSAEIRELRGSSHVQAGMQSGLQLGVGFAAGVADGALGDFQGIKPSTAAGLVAAGVGLATKNATLVRAGTAALIPAAYAAGVGIGEDLMSGGDEPDGN